MRLGELLVGEGLISSASLDEALAAQVVYGARLGTNLVEQWHLGLDDLADALARQHDMAAARQRHFVAADAAIQALLPRELAARWHVVPLGRISEHEIAVAATDPLPDDAVYELADVLGAKVVAAIAPELRILYHLERVYGVQRTNRFRRAAGERAPSQPPTDPGERRGFVTTLSDVDVPPEPPSSLARIAVKRLELPLSGELELGHEVGTVDDALLWMRRATGRDRLGDLVVGAMAEAFGPVFAAGMILTLRSGILFGWKGFVRDADRHLIEAAAIPAYEPSLLAGPLGSRTAYFGPPSGGGTPVDHKLWLLLRTGPPAEVGVVPVELDGRVVCLLYVQSEDSIPPAAVGGLAELAQGLATAFSRLTRAAER